MKKAVILAFILIITVCTVCFSKTNNIYSADISNKNGILTLNIKSDYNEKIKVTKEKGRCQRSPFLSAPAAPNSKK